MNRILNMPNLHRWVQVRDWWSISYEINGRWYVEATLTFEDCRKDKYSMIYGDYHIYCVNLSFWGNDDTGISCKDIGFDDLEEAYRQYKKLRKFLNHLNKMKAIDLKRYLLDHGFTWA